MTKTYAEAWGEYLKSLDPVARSDPKVRAAALSLPPRSPCARRYSF